MRKVILPVVFTALTLGLLSWAQNTIKADQGRPGTQGPWPVTVVSSSPWNVFDGGIIGSTAPVQCRSTALDGGTIEQNTTVGGTAAQVPTNPSDGRVYMNICNSAQNASTAIIKCRQDSTAPVFAAGNPGQVLLVGDCMLTTASTAANVVQCIADAAGRNVTTYECIPR